MTSNRRFRRSKRTLLERMQDIGMTARDIPVLNAWARDLNARVQRGEITREQADAEATALGRAYAEDCIESAARRGKA